MIAAMYNYPSTTATLFLITPHTTFVNQKSHSSHHMESSVCKKDYRQSYEFFSRGKVFLQQVREENPSHKMNTLNACCFPKPLAP
jgi:hypothetical protein